MGRLQAYLLDRSLIRRVSWAHHKDWEIDEPVHFEVQSPMVGLTDRPTVGSAAVPLFSRRVVDSLRALGGFESRVYDALLVDAQGNPTGGAHDFVIFHVRTSADVFDWDRSEYDTFPQTSGRAAGKLAVIRRLVIRSHQGELPTCFYVKGAYGRGLMVNDAGRSAIEALPPLGLSFTPIPTFDGPPTMT